MCWNIFKKNTTPPTLTIQKQVDWSYLFGIINSIHPTTPHIYMRDNTYGLCSKADVEALLATTTIYKEPYISEEHDCDDFTFELMGIMSKDPWSIIAKGIIWTNLHAFMCFIDDTGKLWYIEPQNNQIFDKWQDYFGTEILFIMM